MPNVTKIYITKYPGTGKKLLKTIRPTTKFRNSWNFKDGEGARLDVQLQKAREEIDGWKENGPWPEATFEIVQNGETV